MIKPVYRPNRTQQPADLNNQRALAEVSLTLPFWEDFSTTLQEVPDSTKWAYGADLFVNTSLAQNPPTYKVVTFDGLQGNGTAYNLTDEYSAATDSLVSQPIDLSLVNASDRETVYLSFFWQAGGFGELPEENDSLVLFFSKPETDSTLSWDRKWSAVGGIQEATENFSQVILAVDSNAYFHETFQFKFVAYTSQRGQFDTWHLDYIYLNESRSASDLAHFDRAMTGTPSSLLSPYFSIPASHFFKNPETYFVAQNIQVSCLDDVPHPLEYYYSLENLTTGENYGSSGSTEEALLQGHEIRSVSVPVFTDLAIPSQEIPLDSQVIQSRFYYKTGDKHLFESVQIDTIYLPNDTVIVRDTVFLEQDLTVNDTITTSYLLHDYYAYDDGVAEFAAGVNELYGQVAVLFVLEEPDTLTHIDIYFPNIAPDPEDVGIDLLVWSHLADRSILTRQAFTVSAPEARDAFTRITLSEPALIQDTVYIGYEQNVDDYLGVGFDKNNTQSSDRIFFNVDGDWKQNNDISGALMIRAVFAQSDFVLGTEKDVVTKLYPNPTPGYLTVEGTYDQLVIMDLLGRMVFSSERQSDYDLSFLEEGLYLVKIIDNQSVKIQKIIIQR